MNISKEQLKCIATICSKNRIDADSKETIVAGFSNGREVSSKNLTYDEAAEMQKHLQALYGYGNVKTTVAMVGELLSNCHEMGWVKNNPQGKKVADMARLNLWAKKFSYLHKAVGDYKHDELPKLVTQFEAVYKSFLNRL